MEKNLCVTFFFFFWPKSPSYKQAADTSEDGEISEKKDPHPPTSDGAPQGNFLASEFGTDEF